MQKRHSDKIQYFREQAATTKNYVIPWIREYVELSPETYVLEIGCAEAGNLKSFLDLGCKCMGIDISHNRIELARKFYSNHFYKNNLELICEDIYKADLSGKIFDLIIIRDVLEHIPNQEIFMQYIKTFLKSTGKIFIAFPPWQNPFGGHQQVLQNKYLSKLPWFHLLPQKTYKFLLDKLENNPSKTEGLLEIKKTGISIDRFEKILNSENYNIDKRTFYLINPNYQTKFGISPKIQSKFIADTPWVRNFFTTAAYYLVSFYQYN